MGELAQHDGARASRASVGARPVLRAPALQLEDGEALIEGAALFRTWRDKHSPGTLAPGAGAVVRARPNGHLNFTSAELHNGSGPLFFSYSLTKAALAAATRTMAQAPRVRVNGVGPGPTLKASRQSETDFEGQRAALLLEHGPSPEEIADAVLSLARAKSVTGQMIAVDGGQHLAWQTPDIAAVRE